MTITEMHNSTTGGDRPFDSFFANRYEPMVRLASGMVDQRCTAEEIVQEAFQRVWVRWDELTEPRCYLRTAVVNSCHDELRKRRVQRHNGRTLRDGPVPEAHYLVDVLSEVAPRRREAIVLRYYGGHSLSEVAKAMNIPTGTAKSLIHRGLADMRGALN
jgi:DNA-directed RNA polymerase specialized sigma24 family protein